MTLRFGRPPARKRSDPIATAPQSEPDERKQEKFSIFWFSVQALGQYALLLTAFRFLLPHVWARQVSAGPLAFILVFLGAHLFIAFFEWGFHRYVLHSVTTRWLSWFARGHRSHHGLTPIRLQRETAGSDRYVLNRYPIVEESQHLDAAFPVYALVGFWAFFTPALIGIQLLLPHQPILLAGYTAITWSMCLYEILHAIEHQPYEWWKHATEHPRLGRFWSKLYGFHHMHHANISCNEAISGFFGLPIPDWVFGTYHQPKDLLLEGRLATAKDFAVPPPPGWVRWLDAWARKREAEIHRREA
jgi:hemolysin III